MKCKNCGAAVDKYSTVCMNCGATVKSNKKHHNTDYHYKKSLGLKRVFLIILAIVFIFGSGFASYYYFSHKDSEKVTPDLIFYSGQGIINKDENVLYTRIDDSSKIEYIHSVKLYEGSVNADDIMKPEVVDEDYQYTKNVDKTFRTIFFDLDKQNLKDNENYTYTMEMTFSFLGDTNYYTYYQNINFTTSLKQDVSKDVFDYSVVQDTTESAVTETDVNEDFILNGYWYSKPYRSNSNQAIYSIKFKSENACVVTYYEKGSNSKCVVRTVDGNYILDDSEIRVTLTDNEELKYTINIDNKRITDSSNQIMIQRQNNSVENAEDLMD